MRIVGASSGGSQKMQTPVSTYDIPLWFSLVHQQGSEGSVVKLN